MSDWGGGYVTDIGYIAGFHSIQSQGLMALAALLNNLQARPRGRDEPFHFCDIGCGVGITALITAAANPGWQVTGLDFNPGHIAAARDLAREAGLENVSFLEVDLREFAATAAARTLPDFDAVTMHGVWSWVDTAVQDGILRLLNAKLRAGGLCHVSYNLATGWQSTIGLQRLMREAGMRLAHRSDKRATAGLEVAQALAAAGPVSFNEGFGKTMLARMPGLPAAYLAHEMMNGTWTPLMHGDVAPRMAGAKLEFAGSANLINNFPQLMLNEAQREILKPFDDPAMTELFKDLCRPNAMRNDVFIRGARRVDPVARDFALGDIHLGLSCVPASWTFEFEAAGGHAQMAEGYYRPIFERLLEGPASVRDLLALPNLVGRRDNPSELVGVAIGTNQVMAVPNPGVAMDARCAKLNGVLLRAQFAAGQGGEQIHFAVPATGGGITLPNFEGMILHELMANPEVTEPHELAARLGLHQSPEDRAILAENLTRFFASHAVLMRNFGFPV